MGDVVKNWHRQKKLNSQQLNGSHQAGILCESVGTDSIWCQESKQKAIGKVSAESKVWMIISIFLLLIIDDEIYSHYSDYSFDCSRNIYNGIDWK